MATALAFIGFAYGMYAFYALWFTSTTQREQSREYWLSQKAAVRSSKSTSVVASIYLAALWLVLFPISAPGAALFVSLLVAIPLLVAA